MRADGVPPAGPWLPAPPSAAPSPAEAAAAAATAWQPPAAETVDLSRVGRVLNAITPNGAPHGRPRSPCGRVAIAEPAAGQRPLPSWSCTVKSWHDSSPCGRTLARHYYSYVRKYIYVLVAASEKAGVGVLDVACRDSPENHVIAAEKFVAPLFPHYDDLSHEKIEAVLPVQALRALDAGG